MNIIKKFGLSIFCVIAIAQLSCAAEDYSKMSANELNEAFIRSVKKNSHDEVEKLVSAGVDVNQKITYTMSLPDFDGVEITCTVLEYAAKYGYVDTVKVLIRQKVENGAINEALILAAKEGHSDVIRELLQAKPKVNAINAAMILAAEKGNANVIKELIKAGANVNCTDGSGSTALIRVIRSSRYIGAQRKNRVIEALLEAKASLNLANNVGDTALIVAIRKHDFDTVQKLLKIPEINMNHPDKDGNTAIMVALQCLEYTYVNGNNEQYNNCVNSQKILEELLQAPGIDFHHANKNGDTVIKLLNKAAEKVNRYT